MDLPLQLVFKNFPKPPTLLKPSVPLIFGGFAATFNILFFAAHHNYSDNKGKGKINEYLLFLC